MKHVVVAAMAATMLAAGVHGAPFTPTLSLFPSGTVSGGQGAVVGWGYNITNNDLNDWLVLNDSFVSGSLSTGTFGNYADYVANNFIVINPSSSSGNVAFIQGAAGTGEFDIDSFVPPMTITGDINVDYSLFSQDPNSPSFDPNSFVLSGTVSANAQVTIAPEPGSAILIGLGLLALAICGWRRIASSNPREATNR